MICMMCKKELELCSCPDKEERIKGITESPYLAYQMCTICNKHYALCFCEKPNWVLASEGKPI